MLSEEGRRAVEAVERHADGLAGREELDAARRAFTSGLGEASGPASLANAAVSYLLAEAGPDPAGHALDLSPWATQAGGDREEELAAQADIIRCLFEPPPFRGAAVRSEWLAWHGAAIRKLARAVYEERELPSGHLDAGRLAVLADMLEEAECSDAEILGHLRGPGPHVRGCWPVDALVGRS